MNKLTAEKCRQFIISMKSEQDRNQLSITGEYQLQALEIALPILEQQERGCKSCCGNRHVEIDHGELGIEHMICDKCIVTPERLESVEGEWIEWKGGECPVKSDEIFDVRDRQGYEYPSCSLDSVCAQDWEIRNSGYDIIAYRIIPEQPTNQNGEQ